MCRLILLKTARNAGLAARSNLSYRGDLRVSSVLRHGMRKTVRDQGVAGSNPVVTTRCIVATHPLVRGWQAPASVVRSLPADVVCHSPAQNGTKTCHDEPRGSSFVREEETGQLLSGCERDEVLCRRQKREWTARTDRHVFDDPG